MPSLLLAQGRAPSCVAPVLAGAGLVSLPKPIGGICPIAVGELLRRLTGKCLMSMVRSEASAYFWPAQVPVAVKGGVEKAIHVLRAWTDRHAGFSRKMLVKDSQGLCQRLQLHQPGSGAERGGQPRSCPGAMGHLVLWAKHSAPIWCPRVGVMLWRAAMKPSRALAFAAALQPLANELRQSGSLEIAMHFLDDGVLAGDISAVGAALALVQQWTSAIGSRLNLQKCELVALGPVDEASARASFSATLLCNPDGTGRVLKNFELLGAASDDDASIQAHTQARAVKAGMLLEALAELEDPQVGLRLLRACGFCQMVHSMRCNPPAAQAAALDGLVQRCFMVRWWANRQPCDC